MVDEFDRYYTDGWCGWQTLAPMSPAFTIITSNHFRGRMPQNHAHNHRRRGSLWWRRRWSGQGVFWIRLSRDDALPSSDEWVYWFCYLYVGYRRRKGIFSIIYWHCAVGHFRIEIGYWNKSVKKNDLTFLIAFKATIKSLIYKKFYFICRCITLCWSDELKLMQDDVVVWC